MLARKCTTIAMRWALAAAKHALHFGHVHRIVELHVGVAEMQLDAAPEAGRAGTTGELGQRMVGQRIESAQRDEPRRKQRRLRGGPVVLDPNSGGCVIDGAAWRTVEIGDGQEHCAANAGAIEFRDDVGGAQNPEAALGSG